MAQSAFEQFWETVRGRFPSETSAYFAKPLLKEAFNAGAAKHKGKKVHDTSGELILASGRSGAADAEG
jgi:hypothetical protein